MSILLNDQQYRAPILKSSYYNKILDQPSLLKLEKCFTKALKQVLWIRISHLNQEDQFKSLKPFGILPLLLRLFRHYCLYTFSLIKNGRSEFLVSKLKRLEGMS